MKITPPEQVIADRLNAEAANAEADRKAREHMQEFNAACAKFRAVCEQIRQFLHLEEFKGGFDEYAAMMESEYFLADPTTANTLMHEWSGMNQLCTYLGEKVGKGQPDWWYYAWSDEAVNASAEQED